MAESAGFFETIFNVDRYMPHGYCLLWQPELVWMHVISDIVIFFAYFAIPGAIVFILLKRKQSLPFRWVFVMFALFIVMCGLTHLVNIFVLWYPFYYFQGIIKAITALVSIGTAVMLLPLLPRLLEIFEQLEKNEAKIKEVQT